MLLLLWLFVLSRKQSKARQNHGKAPWKAKYFTLKQQQRLLFYFTYCCSLPFPFFQPPFWSLHQPLLSPHYFFMPRLLLIPTRLSRIRRLQEENLICSSSCFELHDFNNYVLASLSLHATTFHQRPIILAFFACFLRNDQGSSYGGKW